MKITTLFLLFAVWVFCAAGHDDSDESSEEKHEGWVSTLVDYFSGHGDSSESSEEKVKEEEWLECEKYQLPACPREYDPICGTDGRTYTNECVLCVENRDKKKNIGIKKYGVC